MRYIKKQYDMCAPVAQLDRASASGVEGRGFESRRVYHFCLEIKKLRILIYHTQSWLSHNYHTQHGVCHKQPQKKEAAAKH